MRYAVEIQALEDVGVVAVEASVHDLARAARALGVELPGGARAVPLAEGVLHRCGPESIMIVTGNVEAQPLAAKLGGVLDEASAIVADLSDGHGWVKIAGRDAMSILAQGVAIDMRNAALGLDQVARTLCFGVDAILHRESPDSFRIGCRASHAEFLLARLRLARAPAGETTTWR